MFNVADEQWSSWSWMERNSRKIGLLVVKRHPHSHRFQSISKFLAIGRLELWQSYLPVIRIKLARPSRPMPFIERVQKIRQSSHLARQKYVHRIALLVAIGQPNSLETLVFRVKEPSRLIHHCGLA